MTRKSRHPGKAAPVRAIPILSEAEPANENETPAEKSLEDDEKLLEAEREIGINEWIDPETGEPAEGQSPPHLEEE